jgi:hypothetical protein
MSAWNSWYHVTGGAYGTWLRGDERGWRDRKHKTHVEGDYKNPPPEGEFDALLEHVQHSMKCPPTKLTPAERKVGGQAMVEKLLEQGVEVLSFSLDAVHYHFLCRLPPSPGRDVVGNAKRHAYYELVAGKQARKIWAKRCRIKPIKDREHQVNVYEYVLKHRKKGAWVWWYTQGVYWKSGL